ncbi:MAG: acyltransferase [Rickettsiales bacterium]|nr:acyltransferase [Rickettsiales bacterium]
MRTKTTHQSPSLHNRINNFDILRLIMATLVLMSHGRYIFGLQIENPMFHQAEIAVNSFFIISGFLISWSIDRSFQFKQYTIKRLARVYPLYFVVITAQLILLNYYNQDIFNLGENLKYYFANLATLNFISPWFGTMVSEPINGSLWTIKVEIMFYAAIPIYIWFLKRFGLPWLFFSFACAFAWRFGLEDINIQWARQIPGSMAFFIAGSTAYFYGPRLIQRIQQNWRLLVPILAILSVMIAAAFENYYAWRLLYIFMLTVGIYIAAFKLPALHLRYDISYGIYLWHVPVFLTLRHIEFYASQPMMAYVLGSLVIAALSLASAILIELPMIRWASKRAKAIGTKT